MTADARERAVALYDRFIAAGAADVEAAQWWQEVLRTHRREAGALPLEQCARLPPTAASWCHTRSTIALRRLAALQSGLKKERAAHVRGRMVLLLQGGTYRRWVDGGEPVSASDIDLLRVIRRYGGVPSLRTVLRMTEKGEDLSGARAEDHAS